MDWSVHDKNYALNIVSFSHLMFLSQDRSAARLWAVRHCRTTVWKSTEKTRLWMARSLYCPWSSGIAEPSNNFGMKGAYRGRPFHCAWPMEMSKYKGHCAQTNRYNKMANPRGAGVSNNLPLAVGGGAYIAPCLTRADRRSEERKAAIESSHHGVPVQSFF